VWAVPAEGERLLSNLPPCSCSSARFEDDPASQIPVRGARHLTILTTDDPMAINRCSQPSSFTLPGASGGTGRTGPLFALAEVLPPPPYSLGRDHSNGRIPMGSGFLPFPRIGAQHRHRAFLRLTFNPLGFASEGLITSSRGQPLVVSYKRTCMY
jgi:hypothetical protein